MGRQRRPQDHYARRAKREGKAARSIYKLEEIDSRWQVIPKGGSVLDLGCSPGSWMQYAAQAVGPQGRVIGYDLKPVEVSMPGHAEPRIGDVYELDPEALEGPFDVVLSDMAPSTMGDHTTDALRSAALVEWALHVAQLHLKPGGNAVFKILEGGEVPKIVSAMREGFSKVQRLRPKATRKQSTELFLIGLGKRALDQEPPTQET